VGISTIAPPEAWAFVAHLTHTTNALVVADEVAVDVAVAEADEPRDNIEFLDGRRRPIPATVTFYFIRPVHSV
jgi:hypothetical protein